MSSSPTAPAPVRTGTGLQVLRDLPSDVEKIRKLLFEMPVPFSMRVEVFEFYWPLIDNVWCKQSQGIVGGNIDGGPKVSFDSVRLPCRFARANYDASRPTTAGPPVAKRKRREGNTCSCRVKAKVFRGVPGIPDHYLFDHSSTKESDWVHSHTLDESDLYKINSFIKTAAAEEIAKGQMPAEVYKLLREVKLADGENALAAAGGKFMTRQHVGNAKQSLERPSSTNPAQFSGESTFMLSPRVVDFSNQQHRKAPGTIGPTTSSYDSPYSASSSPVESNTSRNLRNNSHTTPPDGIPATQPVQSAQQVPQIPSHVPQTASQQASQPNHTWSVLSRPPDNQLQHKTHIKIETQRLIESTSPGAQIPREAILPLLNSILVYLDREVEPIDGKALLAAIQSVQQTATATRENTEHLMARHGFYRPAPGAV